MQLIWLRDLFASGDDALIAAFNKGLFLSAII